MKTLKQIQEELTALYDDFFKRMNIDPQSGLWKDAPENVSVRFATMPFIGYGYAETPVKILFAAYDLGNDESSELERIQTFDERHDAVVGNPGSPHIAGTYVTTLCLLKDQYADDWNRILANETKSNISVIKDSPEGVLEHVAMTNRWKFVTVNRTGRQGGNDRVYRNKQAEKELFYKEVEILNPDIVWFQGIKAAYEYAETLKAQGRKVYVANHPSNHFGCEINGEKVDCRTPKYIRLVIAGGKNIQQTMQNNINPYCLPPVSLLEDYPSGTEVSDEEIHANKSRIEETLRNFGIPIQRIKATVGPTVTLYDIVSKAGVKISRIQGQENSIAQSLKMQDVRIVAPIPGKKTIGIEVPNRHKEIVSMRSAVLSEHFQKFGGELPVVIGRTIQNENYVFDLAKMPHLLVAGATGQGKSVGLNAIITSLLYRKHPAQLKFVMIDPKMVEFSLYAKIERHFLAKMKSEEEAIITDPRKAVYTLNALCIEMDMRLDMCRKVGARNIAEYNEKVRKRDVDDENIIPYIVVIIDEFADLVMTDKEVERSVMRLVQKAHTIGIHLIVSTQHPDAKIITGGIKANFPARIAFRVMQPIDSHRIIDRPGAEQLIGCGDMLLSNNGELTRIQCALVDTPEVERIVGYISRQPSPTGWAYDLPDYQS